MAGMKAVVMLALVALMYAAPLARAAGPLDSDYILLEDGTKVMFSKIKEAAKGKCCVKYTLKFAIAYSSTDQMQPYIGDACAAGMELNNSTYPTMPGSVGICGCAPAKVCGLTGMNVKNMTTKGGKTPIGQGQQCADSAGKLYAKKTCKAIKDSAGNFAGRLLCKKDCPVAGKPDTYVCKNSSFDYSKCANVGPQTVFVNLGEKCGYTKDNKTYACGGNKTSCKDGVCVSSYPSSTGK